MMSLQICVKIDIADASANADNDEHEDGIFNLRYKLPNFLLRTSIKESLERIKHGFKLNSCGGIDQLALTSRLVHD